MVGIRFRFLVTLPAGVKFRFRFRFSISVFSVAGGVSARHIQKTQLQHAVPCIPLFNGM